MHPKRRSEHAVNGNDPNGKREEGKIINLNRLNYLNLQEALLERCLSGRGVLVVDSRCMDLWHLLERV